MSHFYEYSALTEPADIQGWWQGVTSQPQVTLPSWVMWTRTCILICLISVQNMHDRRRYKTPNTMYGPHTLEATLSCKRKDWRQKPPPLRMEVHLQRVRGEHAPDNPADDQPGERPHWPLCSTLPPVLCFQDKEEVGRRSRTRTHPSKHGWGRGAFPAVTPPLELGGAPSSAPWETQWHYHKSSRGPQVQIQREN